MADDCVIVVAGYVWCFAFGCCLPVGYVSVAVVLVGWLVLVWWFLGGWVDCWFCCFWVIWFLGGWAAFWLSAFLAIQLSVVCFFAFVVWCFVAPVCCCSRFGVLLESGLLGFGSRFVLLVGFAGCCLLFVGCLMVFCLGCGWWFDFDDVVCGSVKATVSLVDFGGVGV